jgi:glycosyltransferase involved in cell wall biosynthesis
MEHDKKKILYVITKSNWGGAQRYVYDLATHLPADRFEVVVAHGGTGDLVTKLHTARIRAIQVQHFVRDVSLMHDIGAFFELIKIFRRERPDVVHLNSAKAVTIGALAARVARVPRIISTVHGWAFNEPRPWWQRTLIRFIEWVGVLLVHETIVVCEHDRRSGTTVIHNGIEAPTFLSREEARRTLGLPADCFIVGTVAELNKNKNIEMLIDAFGEVRLPQSMLTIIGDGEERTSLETRAKEHPACDIRFLGFQVAAIGGMCLKAFDVFVLPSKKEGLPYVLLEAGMAQLPVITTNVGGIPEIVKDGVSGVLVTPCSPQKLTNALNTYIRDSAPRERHGTALRTHIATHFTFDIMVTKTLGLY